jgi:SAM-dependent methyltransferase
MKNQEAIAANIVVHSAMSEYYNEVEPHFRPESISRVKGIIENIHTKTRFKRVLDLGCGTGFMIDIVKPFCDEITGVDVTQAMMDRVDLSGECKINLINCDTATVEVPTEYYDLATAYSFLDHLNDLIPTFKKCYSSLREGGVFYADLNPNLYFWEKIKSLDRSLKYSPIVQREIDAVYEKDKEIEEKFGISAETFVKAEYFKHIKGGLSEDDFKDALYSVGFKKVNFVYHWFIGQAQMINSDPENKEVLVKQASLLHDHLIESLPVSRDLFKYIGFIAEK